MVRSVPLAVLTLALRSPVFQFGQSGESAPFVTERSLNLHARCQEDPNAKACLSYLFVLDSDRDDCDGRVGAGNDFASYRSSAGQKWRGSVGRYGHAHQL